MPIKVTSQFDIVEKQRFCYQLDLESDHGPITQFAQSHSWQVISLNFGFLISEVGKYCPPYKIDMKIR